MKHPRLKSDSDFLFFPLLIDSGETLNSTKQESRGRHDLEEADSFSCGGSQIVRVSFGQFVLNKRSKVQSTPSELEHGIEGNSFSHIVSYSSFRFLKHK